MSKHAQEEPVTPEPVTPDPPKEPGKPETPELPDVICPVCYLPVRRKYREDHAGWHVGNGGKR